MDADLSGHLRRKRDSSALDDHLIYAVRVSTTTSEKQPWERGDILAPRSAFSSPFPSVGRPQVAAQVLPAPSSSPAGAVTTSVAVKVLGKLPATKGPSWEEKLTDNRRAAVAKWEALLMSHGEHFDCYRGVSGDASAFTKSAGLDAFPLTESVLYVFMDQYCRTAAATFGRSFLESLNFAVHVLGLDLHVTISGRIQGVAKTRYLEKRKAVQKPALTALRVRTLEKIVIGGTIEEYSGFDRHCAGFFCYTLYARARFSDAQASANLMLDVTESDDGPYGRELGDSADIRKLGVRAILDYRSTHCGTELVYARDTLSGPLRQLGSVVSAVALGHFRPDSTRSGYFPSRKGREDAGFDPNAPEQEELDSSSSGSEDEEAPDHDEVEKACDALASWEPRPGLRDLIGEGPVFKHKTMRVIHLMASSDEGDRFVCGNAVLTRTGLEFHARSARGHCNLSGCATGECFRLAWYVRPVAECLGRAMAASYSESEAVFIDKVRTSGLSAADQTNVLAGLKNLKQLAFVSSFTPGQADEKPLIAALDALVKRDTSADLAAQACFRALFQQAYAIVTTEFRQAIERTEDAPSHSLSAPEREERYTRQVKKLTGINIKGETEPSQALVDLCVNIYESNTLRYVAWEKCTSRLAEVQGDAKKDTRFTLDAQGKTLKLESKAPDDKCQVDSEVHLLQALQRRALALDQANVVDYAVIDVWHQKLLRARMQEVPAGHVRPSFKQLLRADQKLFSELQDRCRAGIQATSAGRPLDGLIPLVMDLSDVAVLLQSLPGNASSSSDAFNARDGCHAVAPFQGRRVMLIAFSTKGVCDSDSEVLTQLQFCGFALPSADAVMPASPVGPLPDIRSSVAHEPLKVLKPSRLVVLDLFCGRGVAAQARTTIHLAILAAFVLGKVYAENLAENLRLQAAGEDLLFKYMVSVHVADCSQLRLDDKNTPATATFGVFRTPDEFVAASLRLEHPFDAFAHVPDGLIRNYLGRLLIDGPLPVMRRRLDLLTKWSAWADELAEPERALHASLDPRVGAVLSGKKLLLLDRIAKSLDWPDEDLFKDLKEGFGIVGSAPVTGVFAPSFKPSEFTEEELDQRSKFLRPALWAKISSSKPEDSDAELWSQTLAERDQKSWLSGPYSYQELTEILGPHWIPVRRFAIFQRGKLRCIDDLSENSVNSSWEVAEKIDLRAMDELLWITSRLMQSIVDRGFVNLRLSSGEVISGPLHTVWRTRPESARPVLKCVDLKSAYKQYAIRPCDSKRCVVSLRRPSDGQAVGFISHTLPFGSLASVGQFNRVARLIHRILIELECLACNYYDDYPVLDVSMLSANTEKTIRKLMRLLGVICSEDKELPFSSVADLLGVRLDLRAKDFSCVTVANKPDRAREISESVAKVLSDGQVVVREVDSLFGRIQYADSQIMGRRGKLALSTLRKLSRGSGVHRLSPTDREAFAVLQMRMDAGEPRRIQVGSSGPSLVVYTDGACEPGAARSLCTVGGILYASWNGAVKVRYFGVTLSDSLVDLWAESGKKHLIGLVELYALVLARFVWGRLLDDRRVLYFIDHVGVLGLLDLSDVRTCDPGPSCLFCHGRITALVLTWGYGPRFVTMAREAALAKWLGILERFPDDFGLSLSIRLDKENGRDSDLKSSLQDVFSQKASVTISGRAGPLARYIKHCRSCQVIPFPVTEAGIYAFLQDYASHEAPTFARSFLSSLAFAKFTVSLKVSDEVFSPRVRGPWAVVEAAIASGSIVLEPSDRVAAGFFVWTLYARARYSDAQAAGAMTCDLSDTPDGTVGYLESAVERSKTSFSLERKVRYLHMFAPIQGIGEVPWGVKWFEFYKEHGPPLGSGKPLLPSPLSGGGWQTSPLAVASATKWMKSLLIRAGCDRSSVEPLGTHSLKATTLSWSAKFGLPREVRAALGYHARGRDGTELIYGRDNMSAPVRQLQGVLLEVSRERFMPDATRSGYFVKRFEDPEGMPIPPDEVLSESSSEASEDAEDVDHVAAEAATDELGRQWEPDAGLRAELEAVPLFSNRDSRFIHAVASEEGDKFRCGRNISTRYERLSSECSEKELLRVSLARFMLLTMANYSESQSVLQSRLSVVGFAEDDVQKILPEVGNLRRLAFISSFTPGQTDEGPLMQVLKDILKRDLTIADKANWRAVYNEAFAIVTAEMKQRIEKADPESTVRPLSQPERSERYERQAKKLANELRYIPWDRCVPKEAELAGEKKRDVRFTVEESSGKLRIEHKQPDLVADTSSEILVQQALTRRALAMDQANLIEFSVADQWTQRLMKARMQSPAEHFARPTWKQLESADRQLFAELRDKTRAGVQTVASGRPLDSLLPDAMYMNEVSCLLQPFPAPSMKDAPQKPDAPKWERPSPYTKGGGKGKKGKQRFMTRLPAGLEGCRSHTNRGDPICFAFNLGGCSTKGQKCEKGLHICAGASLMAGAPESVRQPAAEASQVDDLLAGVHRPKDACTGGCPTKGVDCRPTPSVDREDHHDHNVGSYSAIARPSPSVVEAARSRSPKHRDGAGPQSGKASSSLDEGHVSAADVLRVFDGLPSDDLKRGAAAPLPTSKSYATGAYVLGGNVGLKANASTSPEALDVFARFVRQSVPGFKFSSINIFEDVRTERHRDQWNANLHNLAIALTEFSGGAIFVEHEDGRDVSSLNGAQGSRLAVAAGPVRFNARHYWHYTEAWQGRRVVLIAYTIRHVESLGKEHLDFLRRCNVDVPTRAPESARLDCFKAFFDAVQTLRLAKLLLASDLHWSILHPLASALWGQLDLPDAPGKDAHVYNTARAGRHAHTSSLAPDSLYTPKFCDVFAGLLQLSVGHAGLLLEHAVPLQCSRHSAAAAAGRQPRLSKFQPQIAEFKCQATVREFPWPLPSDDKGNLKCAIGSIPPGSRLLRIVCDRGVVGAKQVGSLSGVPSSVTFGIYRTEHEFVAQALHIDHPFDLCVAVPDFMLRALAFTLKEGPVGVMKHRLNLLQQWTSWKRELSSAEAELHAAMDPGVASVMKGKNILLLEKIASTFGWPDTEVFDHLKHGFPLVGESSPSGIFDVDRKPALMTRAELVQHAKFLKPALWAKVASAEVDDLAREVWDSTQQEMLVKEWLTGPYSWDELQARHPEGWLPVRRFGIVQKAKTRSIDDLAENSVNRAYAVSDRIALRALDELVWLAITLFKIFMAKGEVSIPLSDGEHLRFPALQPSLKTVDLKSAYKQLAVSPRDRCLSIVTIKDPVSGLPFGFESRTLLFGATSSVVSFNRVARLIQRVLITLQVLACNYFDDYPVLEVLPLCNNTQSTIKAALDLLGFSWAEDKDLPFSHEAELLCVRVDLGTFGVVKIGNKPDRAASIAAAVDSVLSEGRLDPKTLPSLFGRIQFAEGQLHGRLGRLALADLRACTMSSQAQALDATAVQALRHLRTRVLGGTPRIVPACVGSRRSVIFTDGAYEPTNGSYPATVGGVLYHYDSGAWCTSYFACAIPLSVVQSWEALGKRHLIGPVEMYAVVCAREAWSKHLNMQRVTMYVDHSGVLASLVKGSSKNPLWRQLLLIFESCDAEAMLPWFSRVPSASNPADPPSRAKAIFPVRGQVCRVSPRCPINGNATIDLLLK
ncbi:unnamed protein product [Symbiodinium sp. CCMP2592]|nr:unnamed protein product [Symbiodinium sp. CCMP2592]